jgi:hypothetical protein
MMDGINRNIAQRIDPPDYNERRCQDDHEAVVTGPINDFFKHGLNS